ncbi:hypothetical protein K469DRAFT_602077, partial [Zopfia rhizophila CBS 207.26]
LLKKRGWTLYTLRFFSFNRNEKLREAYRHYVTNDIVFLNESLFNKKTGWRHHAYAPISNEARYTQDIQRGKTWAILPTYTINGYLPYTAIEQGYFSCKDFLGWIQNSLIPYLQQ